MDLVTEKYMFVNTANTELTSVYCVFTKNNSVLQDRYH